MISSHKTFFEAAKVIVNPELEGSQSAKKDEPTVWFYFHRVRLITVNGEIWEKAFLPFGLTTAKVIADWDTGNIHTWMRIDPNAKA